MIENDQPTKIVIDSCTFRVKNSSEKMENNRLLLLLHGHRGNENAMWILTEPLPAFYSMLAPRAPVKFGPKQYSWHEIGPTWPEIETYQALTKDLLLRVNTWLEDNPMDVDHFDVMGFSQGATMAFALAILYPEKINKVAALASFIPQSWKARLSEATLEGKQFFIAHGTQDDIIPINKARQAADWLIKKGAHVTFCEADTGHKLSANCFKGLGNFFR
jgi:phospholipase/carboxylesterase